jgi:sulfite reductase alpha subunit-like flavoprotein
VSTNHHTRVFNIQFIIDLNLSADINVPTTIRSLLETKLDIFGRPRRYFFELLSFFATDGQHREKLIEFSSVAGQV